MDSGPEETRHKLLVRILVIVASVLAFLAILTSWLDRQLLDTGEWVSTSGRLIQDKTISDEIASYAVDQLYSNVDVAKLLKHQLPKDLKPLSDPASGALREFGTVAAQRALQTQQVQAIWEDANRAAHDQLVAILESKSNVVETNNGEVTLNLRPVVDQLASTIGIDKQVGSQLPPDVAQLKIVKSDQLKTAQTAVKILRGLAWFFTLATFIFFGIAVYLARGRRWVVVLGYGIGLIVAAIAVLALRKLGESIVVDSLAKTEAVKPAVQDAFSIGTDLLSSIATTVLVYGIAFVLASWLASPADSAKSVRRTLAPSFRAHQGLSWAIFAVLALIFLIVSPPQSNRAIVTSLVLIVLMAIGIEAFERKSRAEFPDAEHGDVRLRIAQKIRSWGETGAQRMKGAIDELGGRDEEDVRLDRLAKLGELRDKGVLSEEEFTTEKRRYLESVPKEPTDKP
jgi:hypothetical protein